MGAIEELSGLFTKLQRGEITEEECKNQAKPHLQGERQQLKEIARLIKELSEKTRKHQRR